MMGKRKVILMVVILIIFTSAITGYACFQRLVEDEAENVTVGSEEYRGFILDNVLHSQREGDIHYNV